MKRIASDLAQALGLRARIGIGVATRADAEDLWPGEAPAMTRAIATRRAEFATGRSAARRALRDAGLLPLPIPISPDRSPQWPRGVLGSITHHGDEALAIVAARHCGLAGLGLDMEPLDDLPADLWQAVLTPPELHWLSRQAEAARGTLARMIFSAKEATYKAFYPLTGRVVGFDAMMIVPHPDAACFAAQLRIGFGPYAPDTRLRGPLLTDAGRIVTAMALPPAEECGQNAAAIPDMEMECFRA